MTALRNRTGPVAGAAPASDAVAEAAGAASVSALLDPKAGGGGASASKSATRSIGAGAGAGGDAGGREPNAACGGNSGAVNGPRHLGQEVVCPPRLSAMLIRC